MNKNPGFKNQSQRRGKRSLTIQASDKKHLIGSLALHLVVVLILLFSWQSSDPIKVAHIPASVKARVITQDELNMLREKKAAERKKIEDKIRKDKKLKKAKEQKKLEARKKAEKKKAEKKKAEAKKKALLQKKEKERKALAKKKREESEKQKAFEERKRKEQIEKQKKVDELKRLEREAKLARQLQDIEAEELEMEKQRQLDQLRANQAKAAYERELSEVEKYVSLIRQKITNKWHIPPGAKNANLLVELKLKLLPSGERLSVSLVRSSGNAALDQSVLVAARSVRIYPVTKDALIFDKNFREITLGFSPE